MGAFAEALYDIARFVRHFDPALVVFAKSSVQAARGFGRGAMMTCLAAAPRETRARARGREEGMLTARLSLLPGPGA